MIIHYENDKETLRLANREIRAAATCGVDVLWGYADNQDGVQNEQLELADHNIRVAILKAVNGERLEWEA